MIDMREYAAQHGWEVGSHLRYAGDVGPSSVITAIEANEVRISTPGDFPGRLTGGSSGLEKWTLDWQYRAEKAEAAIARVRELQMRALKAETALTTTRDALHTAFAIIANAQNCLGDGDPTLGPQWHEAAQRFIQDYNANLDVYTGFLRALDDGDSDD